MQTKKILSNVSGTGNSGPFFIDLELVDTTEVNVFMEFTGGSMQLEASPDNVSFVPIKDAVFSASEVVGLKLAHGTYLRASYSGVTSANVSVKPVTAHG